MTHTDNHRSQVTLDGVSGDALIPLPKVAQEFCRSRRTLGRWLKDKTLGFPKPIVINGRGYIYRGALEVWKQSRVLASISATED